MGHGTAPDIVVLNYDNLKETYTTLVTNQHKQDIANIFQSTDLYKALAEVYKNIEFVSYKTQSLGQGLGSLGFLSLEIKDALDKEETTQTLATMFDLPTTKILVHDTDFLQYTIRTGPSNILYLKVHKTTSTADDQSPATENVNGNNDNGAIHTSDTDGDGDEEKDRSNPHVVQDYIARKLERFASLGSIQIPATHGNKKSVSLIIPVEDPYESELTDEIIKELWLEAKNVSVIDEVGGKRILRYTQGTDKHKKITVSLYLLSEGKAQEHENVTLMQHVWSQSSYPRRKTDDTHIGNQSIWKKNGYDNRMSGQIPTKKLDDSDYFTIGGYGTASNPLRNNIANKPFAQKIGERAAHIKKDVIREALMGGMYGQHRLNPFTKIGNVYYVNDSAATNPNAAWYSLQSLPGPIVWIVGGVCTGADTSDIFKDIPKDKIHSIINISADPTLLHQLQGAFQGSVDTFFSVETMDEVALLCRRLTQSGNCNDIRTVLLSPACASFDLFESYEDRGRQFMDAVRNNS